MVVNLIAVLVAGIVGMVIGGLWYSSLLFGTTWMKLMGITTKQMKQMKKKNMTGSYIAMFIGLLVMAYVLAYVLDMMNATSVASGALGGLILWVGFIATVLLSSVFWEGRSVSLYILNAAYWLVVVVAMGAIIGVWV